eukprot:GHUV01009366.1.p1 GENE.GHUV01009366.1~~GHUV01009366.1.p1  ORF type:complete len:447 (-),score=85.25 GHUV01009366.1:1242-2582(-)
MTTLAELSLLLLLLLLPPRCITMVAQALFTNHPEVPTLPVVDYTLVLAMTPTLCLGLALGVLANALTSQWLLNILIICIWTWSCIQLSFTYRKARVKERQQQQQQATQQQLETSKDQVIKAETTIQVVEHDTADIGSILVQVTDESQLVAKQAALDPQNAQKKGWCSQLAAKALQQVCFWSSCQPWKLHGAIALLFAFFIALQVVRGAITPACSAGYWAVLGVLCGVNVLAGVAVALWLTRSTNKLPIAQASFPSVKQSHLHHNTGTTAVAQEPVAEGTGTTVPAPAVGKLDPLGIHGSVVQYTHSRIFKLNIQMLIAGLMLAAWPLSPIIMALPGMHPQVAAGTSKLMLFLITGGSALSFIASSNINVPYMLAYGITNALATPLGVWVVDKFIGRTGRPSVLLMLTIVRLAVCVVIQIIFAAVPRFIELSHGLPRAGFIPHPLCP